MSNYKRVGIMQPYLFPYLGYFQLINSVDVFVFYDDVNFIKKGWINRNNLLINGVKSTFTVPLVKSSQNNLISETKLSIDNKWLATFFKKLAYNYSKAPNYKEVCELINSVFDLNTTSMSELAMHSVVTISDYLDLNKKFKISSKEFKNSKGLKKEDRLIEITKLIGASIYINPTGGADLYSKDYFSKRSIELMLIDNKLKPYKQLKNEFVEGLSIIDVLMFNDKVSVVNMLDDYELK